MRNLKPKDVKDVRFSISTCLLIYSVSKSFDIVYLQYELSGNLVGEGEFETQTRVEYIVFTTEQ